MVYSLFRNVKMSGIEYKMNKLFLDHDHVEAGFKYYIYGKWHGYYYI